jgi:tetratricopeptide (TPR) repeat protein
MKLGVALAPGVLPLLSTALCWAGRFSTAIERGREAVRIAREAGATDSTLLALQVLGLALASIGAYDDAERVFDEARRFGHDYGVGGFLARSIAMSAGYHLDVFDFDGHAAIAQEACELARSTNFLPTLTSASIDLLLNLARRGDVGRALELEHEVAAMAEQGRSWHGWLWSLRLAQARAEIALARGAAADACHLADNAVQQARGRRPKYEVLGLVTRASALSSLGRTNDAIADLQTAAGVARRMEDPALVLRSVAALLALDGTDALANEASAVAHGIFARLPDDTMRERFRNAEAVRRVGGFVRTRQTWRPNCVSRE